MAGPRMPPKWKVCWYTFLDTFLSSCLKCFDKFLRVVGPFFVVFAVILISGVVYSWFTYILPVISEPNSVIWGIHIVIAVWLTFNVYWNYIKTIVTPPGEPWEDWVDHRPERDDDQIKAHEVAHPDAYKRWCKKCRKPKPPRSHHCSVCKKCVLKMDHHCPWVSNCVGFRNYRTFFLFMAYLWVGCVYIMATSGPTFFRHIHHRGVPNTGHSYVVMSFVLAMSVSLAVGFLLSWHVYLIATNQTTIEWYGNRMRSDFAKKRGETWYNEWDIGWIENVSAVLGSAPDPWSVSMWFVPTLRPPHGDGTRFATRSEKHEMHTLMHVKVGE